MPEPETPYQRAAQVWDERIGSARVQARNWRLHGLRLADPVGRFRRRLSGNPRAGTVVPWVVQVDNLGQAQTVAPPMPIIGRPIRRSPSISAVSSNRSARSRPTRSLSARTGFGPMNGPRIAARRRSTTTPAPTTCSPRSAASRSPSRCPASSGRPGQLPRSLDRTHYENGQLSTTERWTAILTIVIQPPRDAERLRANPLGIYVNAINWSREMSHRSALTRTRFSGFP